MYSYTQPLKQTSRKLLIEHAVKSLTARRAGSFLVSGKSMHKIAAYFCEGLRQVLPGDEWAAFYEQFAVGLQAALADWDEFHKMHVRPKKAGELKVLYLSGPEPFNDMEVFREYGVRLENIWAVESDKKVYEQAVAALKEKGIQIKIHAGKLVEFFALTNHVFDIVYIDACTSITSRSQSQLELLKLLFQHKRLTPLSALITNFAEPGADDDASKALATWFSTKQYHGVPPEDERWQDFIFEKSSGFNEYAAHIESHLPAYYSFFLTHFIPSLAAEIVPVWQTCSLRSVQNNYLLNEQALAREMKKIKSAEIMGTKPEELLATIPHFLLSMDAYPLLSWVRNVKEQLPKNHAWQNFIKEGINKMAMEDAMYTGSLLKRFEEGRSGFRTFIYDICSERFRDILSRLDFFDRHFGIACDIPMKNLMVELLIGLYGYPYIAHAGKTLSLKYKAKQTWMYANVFVFDQCRYLYDFMPTVDLWSDFFDDYPKQTIQRGCIDGIRRNHAALNNELFLWGFMAEDGGAFGSSPLAPRINLNDWS